MVAAWQCYYSNGLTKIFTSVPAMFDDFFGNVLRYQRYFVTVILGIFISTFSWLKPLLNNRITASALIGMLISLVALIAFTLKAMLGFTPNLG
jgi:amino acid permease